MTTRGAFFLRILLTAVLYDAAARVGLLLAFERTNVSPVWPPSGIAFAAILLLGRRVWPGIFLGAFAANWTVFLLHEVASPAGLAMVSLVIAAGNTLEALAGHALLARMKAADQTFATVSNVFRFLAVALFMCLVAATIGTLSVRAAGIGTQVPAFTVWLTWWLGDVAGILMLTPPAVLLARRPAWPRRRWAALEAVLLLALLAGASAAGFTPVDGIARGHQHLTFLVIPPLVWAAVRFGPPGAAIAVAVTSSFAILSTLRGLGPFLAGTVNESLLLVQAYVGALAITHLILAAAMAERAEARRSLEKLSLGLERQVEERTALADQRAVELRRLAAELATTEQRERRQLSRFLHDQVQQLLVAAQLQVAKLKTARRRSGLSDTEEEDHLARMLSHCLQELRDLTVRLSPPILQHQGLRPALEWLVREMKSKHDLTVHLAGIEAADPMDEASRIFAFEALRELLFNVVKHSGSSVARVTARLRGTENIEFAIEDEGHGFDAVSLENPSREGLGLFSISERVKVLGGRLDIAPGEDRGARVSLIVPLNPERPASPGPAPSRVNRS